MKITFKILLITLIGILCCKNIFASQLELKDIKNHWAEKEIINLFQRNIVSGYEDGNFKPDKNISIIEFLKILIEISDYKLEIEEKIWPDSYIKTAIKNNLIKENEFQNFSNFITRYEVARILGRYIPMTTNNEIEKNFKDVNKEEKSIYFLNKLNILNGYEDNTFKGNNFITRAEVCKVILRSFNEKQKILDNKEIELNSNITNIGKNKKDDDLILNRYEIEDNKIYFYDYGRYGNFEKLRLNQKYIDDDLIIKILKILAKENSYVELKYVPDKYFLSSLNILYGSNASIINQGGSIFQMKFYENGYYDVSKSKDKEIFMNNAKLQIKIPNIDDLKNEFYAKKVKQIIEIICGTNYKEEIFNYIISEDKNSKVKQFGKCILNFYYRDDKELEIYIGKI